MKIICQPLGEVQANCYIIIEGENALLIDPGDDYHHLETILKENHAELKAVLLTHAHFDHIAGLDKIVDLYHTDVYCNPKEIEFLSDAHLNGSQFFYRHITSSAHPIGVKEGLQNIGGFDVKAYFLPGHSIGSTAYQIGNNLFTGDIVFQGSVGRVDLPTGSAQQMKESIQFLKTLPDDLIIYPGHGPSSSLGQEKEYNPYFVYDI